MTDRGETATVGRTLRRHG